MNLICMADDGEYVCELKNSTYDECVEHSADMGSRWIFYPYHFIVSDSGKTIIEPPDTLDVFKGKRLSTVVKAFKYFTLGDQLQ